jgi:hypothetical protein
MKIPTIKPKLILLGVGLAVIVFILLRLFKIEGFAVNDPLVLDSKKTPPYTM